MILAVIRHNIGIWSGHHPSYPCSASHPGDTLAHSSSPSLDAFKLLLQKRASCLWDGQTSADDGRWSADLGEVGEDSAPRVDCSLVLFAVFWFRAQHWLRSSNVITDWLIVIWEAYDRNISDDICVATSAAHRLGQDMKSLRHLPCKGTFI